MSTELDGHRIQEVLAHDNEQFDMSPAFPTSLPRQNLAGGTGVFAHFFEEMAEPQTSSLAGADQSGDFNSDGHHSFIYDAPSCVEFDINTHTELVCSDPMRAFFDNYRDDDDLHVLDQYKGFVNRRSKDSSTPIEHYFVPTVSLADQSTWNGDALTPSLQPQGAVTEYFRSDLGSNMCISYTQRCKPPKILAKRFLLGETIGRGSYGKVKDAIDLFTFHRHAVKIISKFGVRKIPGGWAQALAEAAVMRRLPPNRHIVSLVAALRVENPDRLCLVMEHCLGSVHDLQAAGVPATSNDFSLNEDPGECAFSPNSGGPLTPLKDRRVHTTSKRFPVPFPMIATDMKQETKRLTDVFRRRKVSNVEAGLYRKRSSVQQSQQQQQFRRLPEAQAHAYFLQLIDGLHFLHRNGVIHRDIKPANLLLTPAPGCGLSTMHSVADTMDAPSGCWLDPVTESGGEPGFLGRTAGQLLDASLGWLVKLTDFGVSASLSAFSRSEQVSGGQTTPAVQPPEVAKGVQTVFLGPQLDVYSAGVTLYFMLTGRVPFSCQNVLQIFEAIAQGEYTIPGHVSAHAAHLVRKMMHKDPKKRFTLEQIKKHPWVLNTPPPPLTLEDIRERWRSRSFDGANTVLERGYVFWLDPLKILRRPGSDYPSPHIDDTGARILSVEDFEERPTVPEDAEQAQSDSSSSTEVLTGVAPLSVLNALKVHLAMSDLSYQPDDSTGNPETRPNVWTIEDHLAQLGIETNHDYPAYNPSRSSQPRHPSGIPVSQLHDLPEPTAQNPHAFTVSFPSDLLNETPARASSKFTHGSDYCEPPLCPEDLPVAEPWCLPGPQLALEVAPGGAIRTANIHAYTDDDLGVRPNFSGSNNNQCTWHAGSRLGPRKHDLAQLRFSPRAQTVDSGLARHELESKQSLVNQPTSYTTSNNSLGKVHRRLSQWWSSSMQSLRKRFRRTPRFQLEDDTALSLEQVEPVPAEVTPTHTSKHTPSGEGRRSRRWFRRRSRDSATSDTSTPKKTAIPRRQQH